MNVFLLDPDPLTSASYLVDDHVAYVTTHPDRTPIRSCKMAIEGCQLLASAHWCGLTPQERFRFMVDGAPETWPAPYRPTHTGHPWAVAVRSSRKAYCLVREHAQALLLEHEHRTGRTMDSVQAALDRLWEPPEWLESCGWRIPVCRNGYPTRYVSSLDEAVAAYRKLYAEDKISLMPRYTWREFPVWSNR